MKSLIPLLLFISAICLAGCGEKMKQARIPDVSVGGGRNSTAVEALLPLFGRYSVLEVGDIPTVTKITDKSGRVWNCDDNYIGEPDLELGVRVYRDVQSGKVIDSVQFGLSGGFTANNVCQHDGILAFDDRGDWTVDSQGRHYRFAGDVYESDASVPVRLEISLDVIAYGSQHVRVKFTNSQGGRTRSASYLLQRR